MQMGLSREFQMSTQNRSLAITNLPGGVRFLVKFRMVAPLVQEAVKTHITSRENIVSDHVYKLVDVVGSSKVGSDDAIRNAIETAAKSIRNIEWFEVVETRGHVIAGKVAHFQVTLKIGFRLDEN